MIKQIGKNPFKEPYPVIMKGTSHTDTKQTAEKIGSLAVRGVGRQPVANVNLNLPLTPQTIGCIYNKVDEETLELVNCIRQVKNAISEKDKAVWRSELFQNKLQTSRRTIYKKAFKENQTLISKLKGQIAWLKIRSILLLIKELSRVTALKDQVVELKRTFMDQKDIQKLEVEIKKLALSVEQIPNQIEGAAQQHEAVKIVEDFKIQVSSYEVLVRAYQNVFRNVC